MTKGDKNLRIFFLEDNPDDVDLELYQLKREGYEIEYETAKNRKEFFDKINDFKADVVLADYSLPDITGIEAIDICRHLKIDVPVILITGEGNELKAVDSLRLGAYDYIIKKNISGLPARVARVLEIWSDRKAKERAEAEEKKLQRLLFETQKTEAIGRLAGGIAHDFNNILTGIMGYSELSMREIPEGSVAYHRLQSIITLSQRGADLVKQLLIFGRKMPMRFDIIDLNFFIRETMHFLNRIVEETIEIKLDLGEDVPPIECDKGQFTQVLMNLTLNARDAMKGKGVLTVGTEKCFMEDDSIKAVAEGTGNQYVCLSVSDTGFGINEDDMDRIFDPFFTTKEMGKGTGLGLAIVHSVVNGHKGFIRVFSQKNMGTTFKIYLPASFPKRRDVESQFFEKIPEKDDRKIYGNETVLFAEDEDVLRELITSVLKSFGYNVLAVKDGDEALSTYSSGGHKIDLVISDMMMPVRGGVDLFRELKTINPGIKFILVTGYSLAEQDPKILEEMSAILAKPYTPMNIVQLMRNVLDR
ncbi:MAG: response regulator [Nitrospirota bacterium]